MNKKTQEKVNKRWTATYKWALTAEYQHLNQILKGIEKEIHFEGGKTGISKTDIHAIETALQARLNYERIKNETLPRTDSPVQQEHEEAQPKDDAHKGENTDNPLTDSGEVERMEGE